MTQSGDFKASLSSAGAKTYKAGTYTLHLSRSHAQVQLCPSLTIEEMEHKQH